MRDFISEDEARLMADKARQEILYKKFHCGFSKDEVNQMRIEHLAINTKKVSEVLSTGLLLFVVYFMGIAIIPSFELTMLFFFLFPPIGIVVGVMVLRRRFKYKYNKRKAELERRLDIINGRHACDW